MRSRGRTVVERARIRKLWSDPKSVAGGADGGASAAAMAASRGGCGKPDQAALPAWSARCAIASAAAPARTSLVAVVTT